MSMTTAVLPSSSRYPEHAPPASCQEGDLPSTLSLIIERAYPALGLGLRERVRGGHALGPEHEGQLALGRQVALRWPESGARLRQVQGAKVVLVEEAVLARDPLRLDRAPVRHPQSSNTNAPAAANPDPAKRSIFYTLQSPAFSRAGPQLPGFDLSAPGQNARRISSRPVDLVTGATGYVGGRLARRLAGEGRKVRGLARTPERLEPLGRGVERFSGDLLSGRGLERALDGVETAYYLVHSMEPASAEDGDFGARDRRAAENFGHAAAAAGVRRIVYLGGIVPPGRPSPHLGSRLEVEQILLEAVPGSTALRASIVIGAGSSSFRVLVRLVERLRVLPMPAWRSNRTAPIDERDVLDYLALTPSVDAAAGRSLDVAGPDVLTYGEMIERNAEAMGGRRLPPRFARPFTPPASAVVSAVTEQPLELVRPLMASLETDLLPREPGEAPRLYGLRPRPFARAVEHALAEWESLEPLGAR